MKRTRLTLFVAFLLIVIFGMMLFFYQVRLSEVAVVTFFGKVVSVNDKPGLGERLPWPMMKVIKLDERIQNFEGKFEQIKLNDQTTIMLSVYVGYRISDPTNFFRKWAEGSMSDAENALQDLVRSSKNEVASKHDFSDFISTDPKQMEFGKIEQEILQDARRRLGTLQYGVDIDFVQIRKIGLPDSVTKNVFDHMTRDRQGYIDQITSDGEKQATVIRAEADKNANTLLSDADAQAVIIQGKAQAEMMKSLQVLHENPDLATFEMQIKALQEFLQKRTTLLLDGSTSPLQWLKMSEPANTNK